MTNFISPETVDRVEQIILDHSQSTLDTWTRDAAETILAEYPLMIARAELPEVVDDTSKPHFMVDRLLVYNDDDSARHRQMALNCLAAAEHLEQRDTKEAEREKRQNELAQEFDNSSCDATFSELRGITGINP